VLRFQCKHQSKPLHKHLIKDLRGLNQQLHKERSEYSGKKVSDAFRRERKKRRRSIRTFMIIEFLKMICQNIIMFYKIDLLLF